MADVGRRGFFTGLIAMVLAALGYREYGDGGGQRVAGIAPPTQDENPGRKANDWLLVPSGQTHTVDEGISESYDRVELEPDAAVLLEPDAEIMIQ